MNATEGSNGGPEGGVCSRGPPGIVRVTGQGIRERYLTI